MKKILLLPILFLTVAVYSSLAQTPGAQLYVAGFPQFNFSQLTITEAGNDFSATVEESQSNVLFSVSHIDRNAKNFNWEIQMSVNDLPGANSPFVEIRRTGDGEQNTQGSGYVQGGGNYQPVDATPRTFFTGRGGRANIPVMFRLGNISAAQPAGSNYFSIVFTIIDTK